ncbi:MAG TPA: ABC transporter permease [Gaiellaceae bacterium]|nr:ABC transporter permease [Gaiellaceae bacterium]
MRGILIVVGYSLRESLRRRVFLVVLVLTVVFLGLYALGTNEAFDVAERQYRDQGFVPVDEHELIGATMFGLSMFGTLFLGAVLAAFLTLSTVRGDAERGLLQPLVVRPIGRSTLLAGRFVAAAAVCGAYVVLVYAGALVLTWQIGDWTPDRIVGPALQLAGATAVIAALSLLGSVFLTSTANGIAVFMVFGAGLVAGLLGQIGEALGSETLTNVARTASWVLPFEALYQDGLAAITADSRGLTGLALSLGPFGGAQAAGPFLWPWTLAYVVLVGSAALQAFARKDL